MKKNAIITTLDQVTTARDLVGLVSWQGVSTKQEDICRMQDIIGHSTIEELDLSDACDWDEPRDVYLNGLYDVQEGRYC